MSNPLRPLLGLVTGAYATRRNMAGGPGHRGPATDHFNGEIFSNTNPAATAGKNFGDFLRWQRERNTAQWPQWVENTAKPAPPPALKEGEAAFTFINHITFLLQYHGLNVLTDPVYSERVSPVQWAGPRRVRAPGLAFDRLPPIDLVLLSHNHYDHLDLPTLQRLHETHKPLVVTGLGNAAFLREHGVPGAVELDWWQSVAPLGVHITFTPAQHWSGRGLRGRNRTLWGGFVLRAGERSLFFAGDTGYYNHFTEIRERCGAPDVALLPIGAYEPRWFMRDSHMNPDDAVRAHRDLQARLSIATHFGCFQLTDEAIDAPVRDLSIALGEHGVAPEAFRVLEVGETLRLD